MVKVVIIVQNDFMYNSQFARVLYINKDDKRLFNNMQIRNFYAHLNILKISFICNRTNRKTILSTINGNMIKLVMEVKIITVIICAFF